MITNQIINYLTGTCKSLSEACVDLDINEDNLTQDELAHIDENIFECEVCGWWCEVSEMVNDNICTDCSE